MIKREVRDAYRTEILKQVGKDASAKVVLDFLFDEDSEYVVTKYRDYDETKTVFNRLAFIVLFPFLLVGIGIQWVFTGKTGVTGKSRFGKFLLKICGERSYYD